MNNKITNVILHNTQMESILLLSDESIGITIRAFWQWVIDGQEYEGDNLAVKLAFSILKKQAKIDFEKCDEVNAKRSEAGKLGNMKRWGDKKPTEGVKQDKTEDVVKVIERPPTQQKTKDDRRNEFYNKLTPYVAEYGREMVREFFDYWTESSSENSKMRYECERFFDIKKRLSTWFRRNDKKTISNGTSRGNYQTSTERLREEAASSIAGIAQRASGQENQRTLTIFDD